MESAGRIRVIDHLPDLAEGLAPQASRRAARACIADRHIVGCSGPRGWRELPDPGDAHLLFLRGFATVRTTIDSTKRAVEIVGPGDLVSATDRDQGVTTQIQVLGEAEVAVIDHRFRSSASPWPEIGSNITTLAMRRASELARALALMHIPRLPERLHQLLWRLAERWGNVTPTGVRLPFALTQHVLADLSGSRRPSINVALRDLRHRELIADGPEGRLLVRHSSEHQCA